MQVLLTILHVLVSLVLILAVLLQTGKRADLAGAFGGGGSQTAFGARGAATVFSKVTTACAVIFMITSLGLAILSTRAIGRSRSVLEDAPAPASAPATIPAPADAGQDTGTAPPPRQNPDNPFAVPPADEPGESPVEPEESSVDEDGSGS